MDGQFYSKAVEGNSAMDALQSSYSAFVSSNSDSSEKHRVTTVAKARDLIASLETPLESIIYMAWAEVFVLLIPTLMVLFEMLPLQPSRFVAMRIAIDLALFEHLSADRGSSKTKQDLASKTSADPSLIGKPLIPRLLWSGIEHWQVVF